VDKTIATEYMRALSERTSIRSFTAEPIEDAVHALRNLVAEPLGLSSYTSTLVSRPGELDHVFKGVIGSYGKTTGVSALIALLAPRSSDWRGRMECGYVGEQLVLKAAALGLGSCWNAGMYDFKKLMTLMPIGPEDEVVSLVALGVSAVKPNSTGTIYKMFVPRKRLESIASAQLLESTGWMYEGVKAVHVAPSALNRQPWYLRKDGESIVLEATAGGKMASIDLGIAMLHFRAAALAHGVDGKWQVESEKRAVFSNQPPAASR
jgi:nitroreductase